MSDTNRHSSDGGPMLPTPPLASKCPSQSSRNADSSPSAEDALSKKHTSDHCQAELRPAPVHTLSNSPAHPLSNSPVHTLPFKEVNSVRTESEQAMDSPTEHPQDGLTEHSMDTRYEQGVGSPFEHGMNTANEQGMNSPGENQEPLFLIQTRMTSRSANQDKVLHFFRRSKHCVTNLNVIGEKLGIPYGTVRNILRRLSSAGLIHCEQYKNGSVQGIEVWYRGIDGDPAEHDDYCDTNLCPKGCGQTKRTGDEHPAWTGGEHAVYEEERKIDKEKNLSILSLSKEQIDQLWPNMGEAGLHASEIQNVKSAMSTQGFEDNPEKVIAQSLRFIDWQLSQGPIIDKAGKKVERPVLYWKAAMMRNGYYEKPVGYIDPEILALQQLAEEEEAKLTAIRKLQRQREDMEKEARRQELDVILQALVDEGEKHHLWSQVRKAWTDSIWLEVNKNPQAIVSSPGIAATTRIFLRKHYGWPE